MRFPVILSNRLILVAVLACLSLAGRGAAAQLPEQVIDLDGIGENQCQQVAWRLAHVQLHVAICHVPIANDTAASGQDRAVDVAALRRQALALRETWVDDELATAVLAMQTTLDALPHRSLHPAWRVFFNIGSFGCLPNIVANDGHIQITDPCNDNRYDAEGRPLAQAYPALSIPPYIIQDKRLVLRRLPDTLAQPEALPPVSFDAVGDASAAEQMIRAARWGNISRVSALLDAGTDVNSTVKGGDMALLAAVQRRQAEMVSFLLAKGADANCHYPNGLSALDLARIVDAPELAAVLMQAGAKPTPNPTSAIHK